MIRPCLLLVQNDPESGPGTLECALWAGGARLELWLPFRGEPAPPLDGFAGVLAFGGATNLDNDAEERWLSDVRGYVGEVVDQNVPYLGVCLGTQLLAQAAGGEASSGTHPSEIGWRQLEVADEANHDPLFGSLRDGEFVFAFIQSRRIGVLRSSQGNVRKYLLVTFVVTVGRRSLATVGTHLGERKEPA